MPVDPRINSTTMWTPQAGMLANAGRLSPEEEARLRASQQPAAAQGPSPYIQGGSVDYPGGNSPLNPNQFATMTEAERLAQAYGGSVRGDQLSGPGYGYIGPDGRPITQNQIDVRGGSPQVLNAGLVSHTLQNSPGAYGQYLVNRDISGDYGPSRYDTNVGNNQMYVTPDGYYRPVLGPNGQPMARPPGQPASSTSGQRPPTTPPTTTPQRPTNPAATVPRPGSGSPPYVAPPRPNPATTIPRPGQSGQQRTTGGVQQQGGETSRAAGWDEGPGVASSRRDFQLQQAGESSGSSRSSQQNYYGDQRGGVEEAGVEATGDGSPAIGTVFRGNGGQQFSWNGTGWDPYTGGGESGAGAGIGSYPTGEYLNEGGDYIEGGDETDPGGAGGAGGSDGGYTQPPPSYAQRPGSPRATSPYGPGAYVNPMYTQRDTPEGGDAGEGLQYKTENDRAMAIAQGLGLQQDLGDYTNYQQNRADEYERAGNESYGDIAAGRGGYRDQERSDIMNQPGLDRLQLSDADAQSNYLSDWEQQGIAGDPYAAYRQLGLDEQSIDASTNGRNAQVRGALDRQDEGINQGLNEGATAIRNAMYDNRGRQYRNLSDIAALTRGAQSDAATNVRGALNSGEDTARQQQSDAAYNVRGALDYGEDTARSFIDPSRLGLSNEYLSRYDVNDRDMQNIRDRAGRSVGAQTAADEQRLLMDANAQGNTSPLAIQAARSRLRREGAVASANAMSDAEIAAKRLQLDTSQERENTRLGAEGNIANLGTGTELALGGRRTAAETTLGNQGVQSELTLGGRRTAAEQGLGTQGLSNEQQLGASTLGTQQQLGAAEQGAEQYLSNQRQQAEQFRGGSRVGAEQTLGEAATDAERFKTATNLGAGQQAEQSASTRARDIATNRQTTGQGNQQQQFQRGQYVYGASNANNTNFANQRRADEGEYRNYLSGQGTQANQSAQVGNQQRIGVYGTQTGAQNASTGNAIANYRIPGLGERIAGQFAKGGAIKGPTPALVGEAGPELIIDLKRIPHYGLGGGPGIGEDEEFSSMYGAPEYDAAPMDDGLMRGGRATPQQLGKMNPMYQRMLAAISGGRYAAPGTGVQDPNAGAGGPGSSGGGFLGKAINLAKLFMADGGVVAPQREQVAPGIDYVSGPQVTELGRYGAEAVLPLTPRKSNKVTPEMIPALAQKYGAYGA